MAGRIQPVGPVFATCGLYRQRAEPHPEFPALHLGLRICIYNNFPGDAAVHLDLVLEKHCPTQPPEHMRITRGTFKVISAHRYSFNWPARGNRIPYFREFPKFSGIRLARRTAVSDPRSAGLWGTLLFEILRLY